MATNRTFEGHIEARSAKSVLFWGNYWGAPIWFPTSQVTIEKDEDGHTIEVRGWLAQKRGLEEFTHYTDKEAEAISQS